MQPQSVRLIEYVKTGRAWSADTDVQGIALLTPYLRFKMSNPVGSGRVIYLYNFSAWTALSAGMKLVVTVNPTTTINTNSVTPRNQNTSSTIQSVATIAWDQSGSDISGGTKYRSLPINNGPMQEFSKGIIAIYPGSSISIVANLSGLGAIIAVTNAVAHVDWIEETQ